MDPNGTVGSPVPIRIQRLKVNDDLIEFDLIILLHKIIVKTHF
ncbi:hypothetical protein PB1_04905 [Bacillus methanolicus PB1]|uniref:Uncharacterized protein n=1 Tax=Bacillus methanolicus PB1 TaxID=997296 RepID=I3E6X2_BACMT|nr:hypothetical protein PB1_04905 [Bacillus methanolicus PB1]